MQYQVLVRQSSDEQFVASVMGISNVTADGKTEEEAIGKAIAALKLELKTSKVVTVEVDSSAEKGEVDPWIKYAGLFADDPTFDDFLEEVEKFRVRADQETHV